MPWKKQGSYGAYNPEFKMITVSAETVKSETSEAVLSPAGCIFYEQKIDICVTKLL